MMDEYVAVPISLSNRRAAAQMDALLKQEGIERRPQHHLFRRDLRRRRQHDWQRARCLKTRSAVWLWTAHTAARG